MFHSPDVARNVQRQAECVDGSRGTYELDMEGSFHFTSVARLWAVGVSSTYLE